MFVLFTFHYSSFIIHFTKADFECIMNNEVASLMNNEELLLRFAREVCLWHEIRNTSHHCDRKEQHHYAKHNITLAWPKLH